MLKPRKLPLCFLFFFVAISPIIFAKNREKPAPQLLNGQPYKVLGLLPLELPNGELFLPRQDGKHYFINFNPAAANEQPTQNEIDKATLEAENQGRIIAITSGGMSIPQALRQVTNLPVTFRSQINGANYDVTVLAMTFTPTGSNLTIGCRFTLPNSVDKRSIYFGAKNIAVSGRNGFSGDLFILESSLSDAKQNELDDAAKSQLNNATKFFEFPVPKFNNNVWMGLGADSKLSFQCGEFKKFTLSGFVKNYTIVEREDNNGQTLADGKPFMLVFGTQEVLDWQDMFFTATAATGFHSNSYKDIGFHFSSSATDKVIIDLSQYQNPANLSKCASEKGDAWEGIYFESFSVRLPAIFKLHTPAILTAQGRNLFMDANGLLGTITAENVFTLEQGYTDEVNNFGLSLDKLSADYTCDGQINVIMLGRIGLPTCGNAVTQNTNLYYNLTKENASSPYRISIKDKDTGMYHTNSMTLTTGSTVSLAMDNVNALRFVATNKDKPTVVSDVFQNSVCSGFPATLTANNCSSGNIKWSDGQLGMNISTTLTNTSVTMKTVNYVANCFDQFCISTASDPIAIKVYPIPLIVPTLTADLSICSYETGNIEASSVGKVEWKTPQNSAWHSETMDKITANYPEAVGSDHSAKTFIYTVRSNLNGCLSEEKNMTLTVNSQPDSPTLSSSEADNTICFGKSITLAGNCSLGTIGWKTPVETSGIAKPTVAGNNNYQGICTSDKGCSSQPATIAIMAFQPKGENLHRFPDKNIIVTGDSRNYYDIWVESCAGIVHWSDGKPDDWVEGNRHGRQLFDAGIYQLKAFCEENGCYGQNSDEMTVEIKTTPTGVVAHAEPATVISGGSTHLYLENSEKCTQALYWYSPGYSIIDQRDPTLTDLQSSAWFTAHCVYGKDGNKDIELVFNVLVTVVPHPVPTGIVAKADSKNILVGESTRLYLENADKCSKGIYWTSPGYGTIWKDDPTIFEMPSSAWFQGHCIYAKENGVDKEVTSDILITVSAHPAPTITALASPTTISANGSTHLYLNNPQQCPKEIYWTSPGYGVIRQNDPTITEMPSSAWFTGHCVYATENGVNKEVTSDVLITVKVTTPNVPIPVVAVCAGYTLTNDTGVSKILLWNDCNSNSQTVTVADGNTFNVCTKDATSINGHGMKLSNATACNASTIPPTPTNPTNPTTPETPIVISDGCVGYSFTNSTNSSKTLSWTDCYSNSHSINLEGGNTFRICVSDVNSINGGGMDLPSVSACNPSAIPPTTTNPPTTNPPTNPTTPDCPTPATPVISVNSVTIPNGGNATLTVSSCNGAIVWSNNNGTYSSITVYDGGNYTATCTITNDCGNSNSASATGTVTIEGCIPVPVAPAISIESRVIRIGESTNLTATGCTGAISWSNGGTTSVISVNTAGNYIATCVVTNQCGSNSSSATGNVSYCSLPSTPSISVNSITIVSGENGTLSITGCGGNTHWNNGEMSSSITVNTAGNYTVICTVTNDCGSSSNSVTGTVTITTESCTTPSAPTAVSASPSTISSESSTLSATCSSGWISWYSDEALLTPITSPVSPSTTTTYYAACVGEGCKSTGVAQTVTVTQAAHVTLTYTGSWLLCDGVTSTPKRFSGCDNYTVTVLKNGTLYTDNNLIAAQDYAAICKDGNNELATTHFSVSAASSPSSLSITSSQGITITSGTSTRLSIAAANAHSYQWDGSINGSYIDVSPTVKTTYSVIAYSDYGQQGCSSSANIVINIGAAPCFDSATTPTISVTCNGTNVTLTAANCNGDLSWTTKTVGIGDYSVTCTKCSDSKSASVNITTISLPSVPAITFSTGGFGNYLSTDCVGTIQWLKSDNLGVNRDITPASYDGPSMVNTDSNGKGIYKVNCSNICGTSSSSYTLY